MIERAASAIKHIYLHIPFCAKVCPYCNFYVHGGSRRKQEAFVEALCKEIILANEYYDILPETVYFGGGTPSMLSSDLFEKIQGTLEASCLSNRYPKEFTIEVNPATVTHKKARAWIDAGINRISLGVQSFIEEELLLLGRQHSSNDVTETFDLLRSYGFTNINIDLIFGLPRQSLKCWEFILQKAVALKPEHISAYALTYEEDTPFFQALESGIYHRDYDVEIDLFNFTYDFLKASGYEPYEISNFARSYFQSLHNLAYWNSQDYIGFGPSAVSTVNGQRWKNIPSTETYVLNMNRCRSYDDLSCIQVEKEVLTPETLRKERIMLQIRTSAGVDPEDSSLNLSREALQQLFDENLITYSHENKILLTKKGRLVADSVALLLI